MAFNYTVHIQFQSITHDVCLNPLINDALPIRGVIGPRGVLPVPTPVRPIPFYARHPNDLLTENVENIKSSSCGGFSLPVNCEVDRFTTLSGAMNGVTMTNRQVTVRVRTKWSKRSGQTPPSSQSLAVKFYHVTIGGTETWLGTATMQFITTAYVNRFATITVNKTWAAGEKFRVKYVGNLTQF